VVPSEKWWAFVTAYGAGMRVIAAFFGPYAPDALPRLSQFFSTLSKGWIDLQNSQPVLL
jgi:hypothetical protein